MWEKKMVFKRFFFLLPLTILLLLLLQLASAEESTIKDGESTSSSPPPEGEMEEEEKVEETEHVSKKNERSPLQKWLNAEWSQKHEVPFRWFVQQHHRYIQNTSLEAITEKTHQQLRRRVPAAHLAAFSETSGQSLSSNDGGRYVIVRLDKLSREERRKARHALTVNSKRDAHVIDDLHMLVYVDTPHAIQVHSAIEADESAALSFSSMTVLDVYSTPPGARLKLSRVIRTAISRCKAFTSNPGFTGNNNNNNNNNNNKDNNKDNTSTSSIDGDESETIVHPGLQRQRLVLDVRTAAGKEKVVEKSLRCVQSDKTHRIEKTDTLIGCQWSIVSAVNGKGLVRWKLTLSSEKQKDTDDVICRCVSFINAVTRHPAVRWMEIAFEYAAPLNDHVTAIVQRGQQQETRPLRPLWDVGIDGTGEIVGVADSGIDYDSCFFNDNKENVAIYPAVNFKHRKVVSFAPCDLIPGDYFIGDRKGGHGTHVAGTAAGHMIGRGNNNKYDGVAKGAKIFFMGLGCSKEEMLTLPVDIIDIFRPGYKLGARVFSNSWGFYAPSEYTAVEKAIDNYLNTRDDALFVFASGNVPQSGLLTPCRSKNMLCVGAHMNTFNSKKQNDIGRFSAFGPTYDRRQKPDIVAPGEWITSADSDGNVSTKQCTVDTKRGTSMATAAAAGTVVLIRQHLRTIEHITSPSISLLKALAIHSTVYLNNPRKSGFGRLDLSVFFTPTGVKGWFRDRESVSHHGSKVYCFTAGDKATGTSDSLRITLVWTDVGTAMEGSTRSVVNDIDVLVVDSTGVIHYAGENGLDSTNVVEQIRLQPSKELSAGFRIIVYGSDVHDGKSQLYSLVVSGPDLKHLDHRDSLSSTACANNCSGNGKCIGGVCQCSSGYRFVDCSLCDEELLCNGHGTCSPKDLKCKCDNDNFADSSCSTCKKGWYGPSCTSNCTCSGRGKCDKKTGECICPQDLKYGGKGCFSGPNCEYCCRDFTGDNCNLRSYWCREDGMPIDVNDSAGGYIQVNGYGSYPPMLTCRWVIEAPRSRKVKLEYLKFNIEEPTDVLLLYDVMSEEATPLRTDSGTSAKGLVVVSTTNILSIAFGSRWSRVREGFLIRYSFVRPVIPNCTTHCVENALCRLLNGGFCVCDPGWVGWGCTKEVPEITKRTRLIADNPRGATFINFLINDEIPLTVENLSSSDRDGFLFMAFSDDFLTKFVSRGIAVRATTFSPFENEGFRPKLEEMMVINKTCRYARIGLGHIGRDALNITLSVLQNASLKSSTTGKSKFSARVYVLKNTSTSKRNEYDEGIDDTYNSLVLSCNSIKPAGFPLIDVNQTGEEEQGNKNNGSSQQRTGSLAGPVAMIFLGAGIAVVITVFCLQLKRRREMYAMGAIPSEEVVVVGDTFAADAGSENLGFQNDGTTTGNNNDNDNINNGVDLIPVIPTEAPLVTQQTTEQGSTLRGRWRGRRNNRNNVHIPADEDEADNEMAEKRD
ncbi:CUB domain [Trypanosoma melophagium]|uniref:CUB domain n=1 Tax=Trypanosoma melophagium TaxID=715481 RepID=UPI00351A6DFF|nr:CUB domain [Trypanosoma melophagium]